MPRINHDEFVRGLANDLGINIDDSARFTRALITRLKMHLSEIDSVRLSCLGEFQVKLQEEYKRKDTFRKGVEYTVPRKLVPTFRFTEAAREDINGEIQKVV